MNSLRWLFSEPTAIRGWVELQAKSFQAMLGHAALLLNNEDARGAIEEIIAAKGRALYAEPDPTETGNPFSYMAWMGANHAQAIRDQRRIAGILLIVLPILCFIAGLFGSALGVALFLYVRD
jgi:hypothetical protein